MSALMCISGAGGAVRDGGVASRAKNGTNSNTSQRLTNSTKQSRAVARTSVLTPRTTQGTNKSTVSRVATVSRNAVARNVTKKSDSNPRVVARAATDDTVDLSQTRTGAEYERCKTAYFTCMDQFCGQKNDDYRRCSCSNRVYDLTSERETLTQAGEQLTVFTENLDAVGMTAAQAAAMKTASDGELALAADTSASKALLQAILNSIRGENSSVGGKYSDLNSINISFDTANAFGTMDAGQTIAMYNGQNLYSAVYPQCRAAVRADCNDASLQRAITAYLMAVEQDCNTVQTAINNKRKEMKSAIREGGAMLDLARVENRQKHNSDDIATCIANVESAILSEQVCGAGYHKCLDNGEYIDISTGAPIAGVTNFYKLAEMLTFADGVEAASQKLSKNTANRTFVNNFENRTKKFAADALDKCVENAEFVWSEYLDKALLDIYYAQRAKVDIIKQGCFDFVSTCYMNGEQAMTTAMQELTGEAGLSLQPDRIVLTGAMCTDYVNSCNGLFGTSNIIQDYIANRQDTDTLTACRAVVKQCFDNYGGTNYENFYYPYSGLFESGNAPDWFTLYEYTTDPSDSVAGVDIVGELYPHYKSTCAKQLTTIAACNSTEMIERAFGGFDKIATTDSAGGQQLSSEYNISTDNGDNRYGIVEVSSLKHRKTRPTGVATEVYNQVIDILTTQCTNLQGRFIELQHNRILQYNSDELCKIKTGSNDVYKVGNDENMCPSDYILGVDTQSWGACLCWENGGRRSKNGKAAKCMAILPAKINTNDAVCNTNNGPDGNHLSSETAWCTRTVISSNNQVCPIPDENDDNNVDNQDTCNNNIETTYSSLPEGISM